MHHNKKLGEDSRPGTQLARLPLRGTLYVVVAALLWAVCGTAGKFLFAHGMSPAQLVQLRLTLSAATIYLLLRFARPEMLRIKRRDIPYFAVLGTLGMGLNQFTYFLAIRHIKVGVAILLEFTAPTLIALYAVLVLRERLTKNLVMALAMTLVGCALALGLHRIAFSEMNWIGVVAGFAAAGSFAWGSMHGERGMRRYHPWTVLFYAMLFAALMWNILHPPGSAFLRVPGALGWGWVLFIAFFGTVVPFGLYFAGINLIRSTRASVIATTEPVAAALFAFLFLGESLDVVQLIGGGLVVAAVVRLQLAREVDSQTPQLLRREAQWGS